MTEPQQPYGPPPGWQGSPQGYSGPPPGPGQWSGAGYGAPVPASSPGPYDGPQETEAKAVVALVLAVLAYTPVVPFVGAIAALVLARLAERDIDRSGGRTSGRGVVKAARVLAWVHLVFVALLAVVLVLFFLLPIGLSASAP